MPLLCYIVIEYNTIVRVFIDCKSGVSDLNLHCSLWCMQLQKQR